MPHLTRRRAAALGCAALAVTALGLKPDGTDRPGERPAGSTATDHPSRDTNRSHVAELATSGPRSREAAVALDGLAPAGYIGREQPRLVRVARRFLDGYFAFEVRDENWRWGARQVAAAATPQLASELLAGGATLPPVMDEFPPRAEVYALAVEFDKPPTTALVRAEVKRGSDRSDIAVIAHRRETRWVISKVTE